MITFVVDPTDDKRCYGKYKISEIPQRFDDANIREVDSGSFGDWDVIEWQYEQI